MAYTSSVRMCEEEVVVIKWGGGLITEKENFCVPRPKVIDSLAKVLREVLDHTPKPIRIVLVHGAVLATSSLANLETPGGQTPRRDGCP